MRPYKSTIVASMAEGLHWRAMLGHCCWGAVTCRIERASATQISAHTTPLAAGIAASARTLNLARTQYLRGAALLPFVCTTPLFLPSPRLIFAYTRALIRRAPSLPARGKRVLSEFFRAPVLSLLGLGQGKNDDRK